VSAGVPLSLAPGPYVLDARLAGRHATRLPILLARGAEEHVEIVLPDEAKMSEGYIYVPAGANRFGAADEELLRHTLHAQPEHTVEVPAFLIGRYEVTFAEYLDFLDASPPAERDAHRPRGDSVDLVLPEGAPPVLTYLGVTAARGEPLCLPPRGQRPCQDWLRTPLVGVAQSDAIAYTRWLDATGRRPGARLCTEREWERAARGADGRLFVHGDSLHALGAAWDRGGAHAGPDEVGSYPDDESPFGVRDLMGNVAEWVADNVDGVPAPAARGGNWYATEWFYARIANRYLTSTQRLPHIGFRVCASL
jgi:formylglycine-generating enzyme required for sulfatase activity